MSPRISVVICTYDRLPYLRMSLTALAAQSLPGTAYEVLVVDNSRNGSARELVETLIASIPGLRFIHEPATGLSVARNTGWRASMGEYVAFLDDDAIPSVDWLAMVLEAFQRCEPVPGCVGGPIEPVWEAPRPPWLHDRLIPALTVLDLSSELCTLSAAQYVWGANMTIRRELLEAVGGFPATLGRRGSSLIGNEDVYVQARLRQLGHTCSYHPRASVRHHIHAERLNKVWFARRFFLHGVSQAALRQLMTPLPTFSRILASCVVVAKLALKPHHLVAFAIPTNEPTRFQQRCSTLARLGYAYGLLALRPRSGVLGP